MFADNLVRPVALDSLSPGIPVRDDSAGVEHVDGVIGDALHQQLELLLTAPQRLLGGHLLGEIARDFRVSNNLARILADRINHHMSPKARSVLADSPTSGLERSIARR